MIGFQTLLAWGEDAPEAAIDRRNARMPKPTGYTVTPQPVAGQHGPAWVRWLDRYAQEHAAAVAQMERNRG
jgi:hypothetical protein